MKIDHLSTQHSFDRQTSKTITSLEQNSSTVSPIFSPVSEMTDANGQPTKEAFQVAVNKLNEFMEYTNKSSKFIFHEGLGKYYVEVVDAKTEEVIKEIPPKELLDAYYEMQKMIGNIVDQTI